MAEPTQSKVPNYAQPLPPPKLDEPKPKEKTNPFILHGDKILVNKAFIESNRSFLENVSTKFGMTPEEYLGKVATATVAKPFKNKEWVGGAAKELGVEKWTPEAISKAEMVAANHGMKKEELFAIIAHESGGTFSPSVVNKDTGATGLIQFLPSTAADMLLKEQRAIAISKATTPEEVKAAERANPLYWQLDKTKQAAANKWAQKTVSQMPPDRQLDLVDLYIEDRAKGKMGVDNVYRAIFTGSPNPTEFKRGTNEYKFNSGMDKNGDGTISKEEMVVDVNRKSKEFAVASPVAALLGHLPPEQRGTNTPVSHQEKEQVISRAKHILKLAAPSMPRQDIDTAATVVGSRLVNPKSPEGKYMAGNQGGTAAGLYFGPATDGGPSKASRLQDVPETGDSEEIWVNTGIPKQMATGVFAHELGHASGLDHTAEGRGLMRPMADYTEWSDVVKAAAEQGGDDLDKEQEERENLLLSSVPKPLQRLFADFLPNTKPSSAFDYNLMRKSSGEASAESDEWHGNTTSPRTATGSQGPAKQL
jgi:hypothetical protein